MIRFPEHLKEKYKVEPPAAWVDENDDYVASLYKDERDPDDDHGGFDPALVAWIREDEVRTRTSSHHVTGIEDQMALMYALFTTGNY